ncbi:MAG: hypothetical protein N2117_01955 [Anaerolineales bacterium]|nr:hypothetical protein [Anaerolineales bacterium]MCX7753994.1 hypothetical protein [Anaerolineales bacterium]MDW8276800.1 hypothetical protein [Anaerolineales bacterium]
MPGAFLWFIVFLLIVTSTGLLVSREWRWSIALLAGQYAAAFWLVEQHWPLTMAAAKLVTGWMAAAVLGMTQINVKSYPAVETSWPQGRTFRLFSAGLVLLAVFTVSPQMTGWLPGLELPNAAGALVLISLGLLHLGMTANALRVTLGLLTLLLGFETLYATVENSVLVAGLLSAVTLGLALTGSYLVTLTTAEDGA